MKCSIQGCTGSYDQREIVRALSHQGQVVVIERVPAEVCSVCGDIWSPKPCAGLKNCCALGDSRLDRHRFTNIMLEDMAGISSQKARDLYHFYKRLLQSTRAGDTARRGLKTPAY